MQVKVKFLYHEGNNDLYAYFPELNWNNTSKRCYSGNEQHAGCSPFYAMESREANQDEARCLKIELIHIGYELDILNQWNDKEATQFEKDVNELYFNII
jgi:hypothetical protein